MIWSHGFAIKLSGAEHLESVAIVSGDEPIEVASSFTTFLRDNAQNSARLFG